MSAELPPLPEPIPYWEFEDSLSGYTADQLSAYASAAVAAEREQRARTTPDLHATAALIVDACGGPDDALPHVLAALQTLAEAERERCAKLCETLRPCERGDCDDLAARIRARG